MSCYFYNIVIIDLYWSHRMGIRYHPSHENGPVMMLAFCSRLFSFKGECTNILYDNYQFARNSYFSIIHAIGHTVAILTSCHMLNWSLCSNQSHCWWNIPFHFKFLNFRRNIHPLLCSFFCKILTFAGCEPRYTRYIYKIKGMVDLMHLFS